MTDTLERREAIRTAVELAVQRGRLRPQDSIEQCSEVATDAILALSLPAREVGEREALEKDADEIFGKRWFCTDANAPLDAEPIETDAPRRFAELALATTPAPQMEADEAIRREVVKLYCASGCSCCRDDEKWEAASNALGKLFGIPEYDDGSGYDWYAARATLAKLDRSA